jgi:hypothetical protein
VRFTGLPLERVVPMASTIPATFLGDSTAGRVTADWDPESAELAVTGVSD